MAKEKIPRQSPKDQAANAAVDERREREHPETCVPLVHPGFFRDTKKDTLISY
jgi:hypothetical protein